MALWEYPSIIKASARKGKKGKLREGKDRGDQQHPIPHMLQAQPAFALLFIPLVTPFYHRIMPTLMRR